MHITFNNKVFINWFPKGYFANTLPIGSRNLLMNNGLKHVTDDIDILVLFFEHILGNLHKSNAHISLWNQQSFAYSNRTILLNEISLIYFHRSVFVFIIGTHCLNIKPHICSVYIRYLRLSSLRLHSAIYTLYMKRILYLTGGIEHIHRSGEHLLKMNSYIFTDNISNLFVFCFVFC